MLYIIYYVGPALVLMMLAFAIVNEIVDEKRRAIKKAKEDAYEKAMNDAGYTKYMCINKDGNLEIGWQRLTKVEA